MKESNKYNQGISVMSRTKCRKIISIVNDFYEVNCLEFSRKRGIVAPRQVAMYYTHKLTNLTFSSIGIMFNKDHATVMHSINVVEGRMDFDREFKDQRPKLEELIFGVNFKTTDEFLLFKAKESINELVSKMSLEQCSSLKEIIDNFIIFDNKKLETLKS
tara:strand:- start:28 stop:507 length:480 start_codon:yes stop_codon:yes gene_type:complete